MKMTEYTWNSYVKIYLKVLFSKNHMLRPDKMISQWYSFQYKNVLRMQNILNIL